MGGAAKSVSNAIKSPTRTFTGLVTGGASEIWRASIPGAGKMGSLIDKKIDKSLFGYGGSGGLSGPAGAGIESPAQTLAMSGGAPLLANVAMGVDPKQAIAAYFGASDYNKFYDGLSDSDKQLVDGVTGQLTSIQSNTELKNKAVQQVVNDFPNVVAQARQQYGDQFDATTKQYVDQALQGTAAKYAANGSLSSGAMAAASARVGAEQGMNKLSYMDQGANMATQGWQARYNEANALRNFQNLMTQGAAGQGFSAVQASLNRNNSTQNNNANMANQNAMADKANQNASDNALFGAIGGLAGTAAGAFFGGPAGAAIGGKVGGSLGGSGGFPSGSAPGSPYGSFSGNPSLNLPRYY